MKNIDKKILSKDFQRRAKLSAAHCGLMAGITLVGTGAPVFAVSAIGSLTMLAGHPFDASIVTVTGVSLSMIFGGAAIAAKVSQVIEAAEISAKFVNQRGPSVA